MVKLSILTSIFDYIAEYNKNAKTIFAIDSIKIDFSKQYKLNKLNEFGVWRKVKASSKIAKALKSKLQKRISDNQLTSAMYLDSNIVYYNLADETKKYRKAKFVAFGLKQYHQDMSIKSFDYNLVDEIVTILKPKTLQLDICIDFTTKPDINNLIFNGYKPDKKIKGVKGITYYFNNPSIPLIDKFYIYDKQGKNALQSTLYRLEAQITVANTKALYLPLNELEHIYNLIKG